jgi:dTDP-4-dehydrorhamnose reductase
VTNSGSCSWFQFAQEILSRRNSQAALAPINSARCGRPALRPRNSVLRNLALEQAGLGLLPPWQDGLAQYLDKSP